MSVRQKLLGLLAAGIMAGTAAAQNIDQTSFLFRRQPAPCPTCETPVTGPVTVMPSDQGKQPAQPPVVDAQAFAQAPASGAEGGMSFNPAMFGDLGVSGYGLVKTSVTTVQNLSTFPATTTTIVNTARVPIVSHAAFKISDVESPRPTDRVYFNYNFYDRIPVTTGTINLNRELIGFEKTFLGGDASIGMRLPFLQSTGGDSTGGFASHEVGDLSVDAKFALINNRDNGNVLAGGLVLTVPTADHTIVLVDGRALRDVLIQPYVAWLVNRGSFFAHGFTAIVAPTDSRDVVQFNNDVGVGVWAYRNSDGLLRGIVPTIEGHVYTPLNDRNTNDLIFASNVFTLTGGVTVVLPGNSSVGAAVAAPLTGPRLNNVEALVSVNFRF